MVAEHWSLLAHLLLLCSLGCLGDVSKSIPISILKGFFAIAHSISVAIPAPSIRLELTPSSTSTVPYPGTPVPTATFTTAETLTTQPSTPSVVRPGPGPTTATATAPTTTTPSIITSAISSNPLSCPQNALLPEDPVFPWRTFSFAVGALHSIVVQNAPCSVLVLFVLGVLLMPSFIISFQC
jgi:hypothetical protein